MFEVKNLDVGYSYNVLISRINYNFEASKVYSILGDNGVGKTTLMKTLTGFLCPLSGTMSLEKTSIDLWGLDQRSRYFSILFSRGELDLSIKVREVFEFSLGKLIGKIDTNERFVDFVDFFSMRHLLDLPMSMLSDGQKQLVMIARALIKPAKVYLLDEPTIYLDIKTKDRLLEFINNNFKNNNSTMIMISHDLDFVSKVSDQLLKIEHGVLNSI